MWPVSRLLCLLWPRLVVTRAGVVNLPSRCLLSCSAGHLRLHPDQGWPGGGGGWSLCHPGEMWWMIKTVFALVVITRSDNKSLSVRAEARDRRGTGEGGFIMTNGPPRLYGENQSCFSLGLIVWDSFTNSGKIICKMWQLITDLSG